VSAGGHATIRFYAELAELAWDVDRLGEAEVRVPSRRSVKDAIESCGVPHTEVDLVLVNGDSVGFDRLIVAGDRVSVFPPFAALDVTALSAVRPPGLTPVRFLLDVHLGRLAERLRLLGFDTAYRNDADDHELVAEATAGPRWLLTRDRALLMRASVVHGYLVRAVDPRAQTTEVLWRFRLSAHVRPLTRCARCNGLLEAVAKAEVADQLEPGTRSQHHDFARCRDCAQVYWRGAHYRTLQAFVAEAAGGTAGRATGGTAGEAAGGTAGRATGGTAGAC
jgi:hypothetical protein